MTKLILTNGNYRISTEHGRLILQLAMEKRNGAKRPAKRMKPRPGTPRIGAEIPSRESRDV